MKNTNQHTSFNPKEILAQQMSKIDEHIRSISGVRKRRSEKTTEYAKRALRTVQNRKNDPQIRKKVEELEVLLDQKAGCHEDVE